MKRAVLAMAAAAWLLPAAAMAQSYQVQADQVQADDPASETDLEDQRPIILYHPPIETQIIVQGGNLTPNYADHVSDTVFIRGGADAPGERTENWVRSIPGLVQFRRSDGRSANPTSQGLTLRGLGGNAASRLAVLLDGIPQADPFGGWINWGLFDALPTGGVRLVRGGSGTEGSGAVAGTLSLYSAQSVRSMRGAAAMGSRDSFDISAASNLEGDAGRIILSGRYQSGDGFQPITDAQAGAADRRAPYRQWGGGVRAVINNGSSGRLEVALRGNLDQRDRGLDFTQSDIGALDASVRYLNDSTPYDGWQYSVLAYVQLREFESQFAAVTPGRAAATPTLFQRVPALGIGLKAEVKPDLGGANPLRLGLEYRSSQGATREQFFFAGTSPQRQRRAGGESDIWGIYSEFSDIILSKGMADSRLAISVRLDRWALDAARLTESDIGGAIRSDIPFAPRTRWEPSGRIGFGWNETGLGNGGWSLRSAAYRSWRLPTLNELYRPFRVGSDAVAANAALVPERLWGFETGVDYDDAPFNFSATLYWNRLSNAVANVTQASGPGNFPQVGFVAAGGRYLVRRNLDAIVARGADVSMGMSVGPNMRFSVSYAFVDSQVEASGLAAALDGLRPAQVARHNATAQAAWQSQKLFVALDLRYAGAQFEDDQNRLRLRPAVTADAVATYEVREGWRASLRLENLFDARVPVSISSTGIVERGAPRTIWLGLQVDID